MRSETQKRQTVECINAFIEQYKPCKRYLNGKWIAKGARIVIDSKLQNPASLKNKLFLFASQNGFIGENYIGYTDDLLRQLRSAAPLEIDKI